MGIMGIIYAVIIAAALGGGALFVHGYAEGKREEGRQECRAAIAEANAKAKTAADALAAETQKHIEDMTTAYQQGEKEANARVVYLTKKGASDVAAHPEVFKNAACTLPPDALRTLNAARGGLRRDPPPDVVRVDVGTSSSATAGPAANPGGTTPAVRGADTTANGNGGGGVPADASGRRPLGKVH